MPTKFPIDYQPGKVQAFLFSKETGQMIEATPLTEIAPKPWPIDDIEIETEPEPPKSLTLSGTFTLSWKKSKKAIRDLKKIIRKNKKVPRKLKKALKHIDLPFNNNVYDVIKSADGTTSCMGLAAAYRKEPGYPYTKAVRKAIGKINRRIEKKLEDLLKMTL